MVVVPLCCVLHLHNNNDNQKHKEKCLNALKQSSRKHVQQLKKCKIAFMDLKNKTLTTLKNYAKV